MSNPQPFSPGASASLSVSTSTSNITLPSGGGTQFLLQNEGTDAVYFATGDSSVTASTGGTPLLGGESRIFTLDPSATTIAAITGSGSATLHITRGEGN